MAREVLTLSISSVRDNMRAEKSSFNYAEEVWQYYKVWKFWYCNSLLLEKLSIFPMDPESLQQQSFDFKTKDQLATVNQEVDNEELVTNNSL